MNSDCLLGHDPPTIEEMRNVVLRPIRNALGSGFNDILIIPLII